MFRFSADSEELAQCGAAEVNVKADAFVGDARKAAEDIVGSADSREYYEELSYNNNKILNGLEIPVSSVEDLASLNMGEMGEVGSDLFASVATASGINNLSVSEIEYLKDIPIGELGKHISAASDKITAFQSSVPYVQAQMGINMANEASAVTGGAIGLYSVTSNALEDGKITLEEAKDMAVSSVSLGVSTVSLYAAGVAAGPIGIAVGVAVAVYTVMDYAFSAGQMEYEAEVAQAEAQMWAHADQLNTWEEARLNGTQRNGKMLTPGLNKFLEFVEGEKDINVSKIAKLWNMMELKLGVRFDIRFFPGDEPPPRGGYKRIYKNPKMPDHDFSVAADSCSRDYGCLYFPDKDVSAASGRFLHNPKTSNTAYLDSSYAKQGKDTPYYAADKVGKDYRYFAKTVRALEALVHPSYKFMETVNGWNSNTKRVWSEGSRSIFNHTKKANRPIMQPRGYWNFVAGGNSFPADYRPPGDAGDRGIVGTNAGNYMYGKKGELISNRMMDYYDRIQEGLGADLALVQPLATRVVGDLLTTSNVIQSEMITANMFRHLFDQSSKYVGGASVNRTSGVGLSDDEARAKAAASAGRAAAAAKRHYPGKKSLEDRINTPVINTAEDIFQKLSVDEKDGIPIFDEQSQEEIIARSEGAAKSRMVNGGVFLAGGVAAYVGNKG